MIAILSPYEKCPVIVGENLKLRLVNINDAEDLLMCYSDQNARLLFNSDNCINRFEYSTLDEMKKAIEFWIDEYKRKYYVRFSIVDQKSGHIIGTIEMFTKQANDEATTIGVLRIDIQSSFESEEVLDELVQLIEANFPKYFAFTAIVTKVVKIAEKRVKIFQNNGFAQLTNKNIVNFDDYYIKYH